jgi:glutathione peroxidase
MFGVAAGSFGADAPKSDLEFKMKSISGEEVDLSKYKGKVLLVVNVASRCGNTGQYKQMEELHEKYGEKGLAVLGFPCNQFGGQEPGTEADIQKFCQTKYNVKFDMFAKVDVNDEKACNLYQFLTSVDTTPVKKGRISWNFEKFIIGRDGQVVARFKPGMSPSDPEIIKTLEAELAKK